MYVKILHFFCRYALIDGFHVSVEYWKVLLQKSNEQVPCEVTNITLYNNIFVKNILGWLLLEMSRDFCFERS